MVGQIKDILFDGARSGGKKVRVSGTRSLTLSRQHDGSETDYTIVRKSNGKSTASSVFKNGKNLSIRTASDVNTRIQKIFPITEEEFESTIHVDVRKPSVLQYGTTKQRREHIVRLFRLDQVDSIRAMFNAELRRISEDKAVHNELERQYKDLPNDSVDVGELERDLASLNKRFSQTQDRLDSMSSDVQMLTWRKSSQALLTRWKSVIGASDYKECMQRLERLLARYSGEHKAATEWDAYVKNEARYKELLSQIPKKPKNWKLGEKQWRKLTRKLDAAAAQLDTMRVSVEPKLNSDVVWTPDLEGRLRNGIADVTAQLKQTRAAKDGRCSLCGQRIKHDHTISEDELEARKTRMVRMLNQVLEARGAQEEYRDWKQKKKQWDRIKDDVDAAQEQRSKYKECHAYAKAQSKLPDAPKKPTSDRPELTSDKLMDRIQSVSSDLDFLRGIDRPKLVIRAAAMGDREAQSKERDIDALQQTLRKIQERIPKIEATLYQHKQNQRNRRKLKQRMTELRSSIRDEPAYKLLVDAYSNKGIRQLMLNRIGTMLSQQLNKFSRYLFVEDYAFECEVTATAFNILVKRKYGRKHVTSDVSKLSGAESNAFSVLMVMALRTMTPSSRRANLLILDEPTANMGQEMRDHFARFVKALNKVIPHIIVVTPLSDEVYENSRTLVAVKDRLGRTTLTTRK